MNMNPRIPLLLLAVIVTPALAQEPPPPQGLLETYRQALVRDPVIAGARATRAAAGERVPQARALFLPSLNASANTTYNDVDVQYRGPTVFPGGTRQYNSSGYALALTQPLYRPQSWPLYKEAKSQTEQAEAQWRIAEQDLILRVTQAYLDVLLAQDSLALAGAQKAAIKEQLDQARRGFELGTVTITDAHEAQSRFDLVTAQEIAARNDLEIARAALASIIGRPAGELKPLSAELELVQPQPDDLHAWVEAGLDQSLPLRIQEEALEIAAQEVKRNRGGHLPSIDIVGSYSDTGQAASTIQSVGSDTTASAIGLQLQLPLYQGGAVQSRVREALANRDRAREDLEAARRDIELSTRQAFLGVTNGLAQVQALQQALVSSESALNSNRRGFEVGVRTSVDVLNAQQQLYNARRDLARARYQYLLNRLRLEAAVAALTEEDLARIDQSLVAP